MSVALTKQVITGSELPTGDLVAYVTDSETGLTSVLVCGATGVVTKQALVPFPPTTFVSNPVEFVTLKEQTAGSNPLTFLDINTITLFTAYELNRFGCVGITTYSTGTFIQLDSLPFFSRGFTFMGPFKAAVIKLTETAYVAGLGTLSDGNPNLEFITGLYTSAGSQGHPINVNYCDFDGNSVLSYGVSVVGDYAYALLKRDGTAVKLGITSGTTEYVTYTVPAGGEIKHFDAGYYITTDGAANLFLYSINNGGELVTQLTPGTFNADLPLEFFSLV